MLHESDRVLNSSNFIDLSSNSFSMFIIILMILFIGIGFFHEEKMSLEICLMFVINDRPGYVIFIFEIECLTVSHIISIIIGSGKLLFYHFDSF